MNNYPHIFTIKTCGQKCKVCSVKDEGSEILLLKLSQAVRLIQPIMSISLNTTIK